MSELVATRSDMNLSLGIPFEQLSCASVTTAADGVKVVLARQLNAWASRAALLPALANHVLRVVLVRAQKQVIGVDAVRDITAMAYEQAIGNLTVPQRPRDTMRNAGIALSRAASVVVTRLAAIAHQPAAILGLHDTCPELVSGSASHLQPTQSTGAIAAHSVTCPKGGLGLHAPPQFRLDIANHKAHHLIAIVTNAIIAVKRYSHDGSRHAHHRRQRADWTASA
jgi:hypothetical protein